MNLGVSLVSINTPFSFLLPYRRQVLASHHVQPPELVVDGWVPQGWVKKNNRTLLLLGTWWYDLVVFSKENMLCVSVRYIYISLRWEKWKKVELVKKRWLSNKRTKERKDHKALSPNKDKTTSLHRLQNFIHKASFYLNNQI